ncbi:MAG: hypothetical protein GY873_30260 [Bosea sp.]|uniref:hypothetical protein n=1 Tax=Bosea sp. (in: a-proteobacteria) TaxID=1871050 RepID=UPI0023959364|nr:hypothetical protein [Bosea sp. (in: a-proteobacteria)]MCP4738480.1 hypothetical protein [Bosea sp. (in: a-proteobacteria)]
MTLIEQVVAVATAYCAAEQVEVGRASWRAFAESKTLGNLIARKSSPTLERADRALWWFSANWPADAEWPAGVPRPDPSAEPKAPRRRRETVADRLEARVA